MSATATRPAVAYTPYTSSLRTSLEDFSAAAWSATMMRVERRRLLLTASPS